MGSTGDATNNGATLDTSNEKLGTGCLSFTVNDFIEADDIKDAMTTVGSVSCWIYVDTFDSGRNDDRVWEFGDANANTWMSVAVATSGKFEVFNKVGGTTKWVFATDASSLSAGSWHHLVMTHDGTEVRAYVNGVEGTNFNMSLTTDKTTWIDGGIDSFRIGAEYHNTSSESEFFYGDIDDFAIWNTVLPIGTDENTAGSVKWLYNTGTGRLANTIPEGLRVYYNCDSATVTNTAIPVDEKAALVTSTAQATAGWTSVGSTVTISSGALRAASVDTSSDDRMYKALGTTLSNGTWVCQFEANISTSNHTTLIGLVDGQGNMNGESILCDYNGSKIIMREYNNSSLTEMGSGITVSTGTQYYVTVTRTATDGLKLEVRTGSHSGALVSGSAETGTITGATDLDTVQSGAYGRESGSATYVIDNIKIYNGVTTATGTPVYETIFSASSDLPENTIFEQTDNQGVFWLQSDAWVYGGAYEAISCGGATNNEVAFNTTYISSDVIGGAWTASATMPDNTWQLGSSMGDSGRSTFMIWGGHNNTAGDNGELDNSYKFNGTTWGSNIDMARNTSGCANGGGSSGGALCCGGRDGNSGEYLINDTEKFNGTSWSDAGDVDTHLSHAGGDGDNTDYLRVAGTGSSNGQNPTFYTSTVQSYNGSSWSGSPTNLGTAISYNRYYGNTSDGIVIGGKNPNVTADVETYNGSSWTDVASIPVAKRHITGGSNNTLASTKVIIWGGHFDSTSVVSDKSHLWNGTTWTEKNAIPVANMGGAGGVKGL
jgi:hypothetical protein